MDNLRKGFPVLEHYTYLNTAASGLLHEKVFEFRQSHDLDFLVSGSILKEKQGELLAGVREQVGHFFNCEASRVGLIPNFSYGFNTLLEAMAGYSRALLLKNDYPSINWAVTSRDFEVNYAEIDAFLEENIRMAFEKYHPQFFAFSLVQYINGIKIDLDFIKKLKKDFPAVLFIADGTQFCGTETFNFEESGIDILISSTYKWLNGAYGNGFMLFKKEVEGKIKPKHLGFNSLQGKYKIQEDNFLGKFEPGHQDTLNYGSLGAALRVIEQKGFHKIEKQLQKLKKLAKEEFSEMGLLEEEVVKRKVHSSIFNIKGNQKLFEYLRNREIIVSQRGEGIRVSFHYFNTEDELQFLIDSIKKFN